MLSGKRGGDLDRRQFLQVAGAGALGLGLFGAVGCGDSGSEAASGGGGGGSYKGEISASLYKEVPDNVVFMVALKQGYFKDSSLNLDPVSYKRGSDAIRGVAKSGMGSSSALSGILAYAEGLTDLRIVGTNLAATTNVFLTPAKSSIRTPADLKGKKLGVSAPTTSVQLTALAMLESVGLTDKDVKLIDVKGGPESIVAMQNGLVDAGWSSPPMSVELVQKGEFRLLYEGASHPPQLVNTALFSTKSMLDRNGDAVKRWIEAIAKAHAFLKADPAAAGRIYAGVTGVDEAVATATIERYAPQFKIGVDRALFDSQIAAAKQLGTLTKEVRYEDLVFDEYARAAGSA
ncbi:ABC transporter substrate-binding protein [Baekduia sp.]|uniref:ABC transporter substrate-binding protein n=1 Tax=Baekduia sp. TaxID=2600305 RepID=UPI002D776AAD|nr:ABC transporter substrate-binding protein [Baekduia sp.]